MAFAAIHAAAGRIDATVPDLGCGLTWDQVHKVRPRVALRCPECGHGVHAKVSSRGLRHFAHNPGRPPDCAWLNESLEHHQLKLALATAVRAAGWRAELEVTGPGGVWRADVLASSPDGARRIAWEAQLSQITDDDIRYRTARYDADDVEVCWVSPAGPAWMGIVPSIRVAERSGTFVVVDGAAWFHFKKGSWQLPADLPLVEFIRGVQDESLVFHDVLPRYRQLQISPGRYARRRGLWVSAASIEAEGRHEVMRQRQDAWKQHQQEVEEARQEAERQQRELEERQQEAERAAEQARLRQELVQRSVEQRRQMEIWLEQERQRRAAEEQRRQTAAQAAEREQQRLDKIEADAGAKWLAEISEARACDLRSRVAEHVWRHEGSKTAIFDAAGPIAEYAYGTAI